MKNITIETLENVYRQYNKRGLISPDPLEFLFAYKNKNDREITALIASSLAYGRVSQILKSISHVLHVMGNSPYEFIKTNDMQYFLSSFAGFKHRFTTGEELADFLHAIKQVIAKYGSLEKCFNVGYNPEHETIHEALTAFVAKLRAESSYPKNSLLPNPALGSACKRLNLFLRWMVRSDDVDPGGWNKKFASKLIVPLDTHMFHFGRSYGFTARKNADLTAAKEITAAFRKLCPHDPVKFDFAITRFGIRHELNWNDLDKIVNE